MKVDDKKIRTWVRRLAQARTAAQRAYCRRMIQKCREGA